MSLQAATWRRASRGLHKLEKLWGHVASEKALNLLFVVGSAICFSYVYLAVKMVAGDAHGYAYGDFYALWTSAVVTHDGSAALNYDADALHGQQVALGMHPLGYDPFPYPPTLLLLLGPLGGLSLRAAFWLFVGLSFAAYIVAVGAGRWREWWAPVGAALAPATAVTIIFGQTGFLSGALMIGGLRLANRQPILSGLLFGLLAYKPQLGVLIPIALVAAGLWRTIAAATLTVALCVVASSLAYGFALWPLWVHAITEYATRFPPIFGYMPTIYANAVLLGAPASVALAAQLCVSIAVAAKIWSVFRRGVTAQACALLLVGTFLATPHVFNYDMPMLTPAIFWYLSERYRVSRGLDVGEIVALVLILATPYLMLQLTPFGIPMSWAPEGLFFVMIGSAGSISRRPIGAL